MRVSCSVRLAVVCTTSTSATAARPATGLDPDDPISATATTATTATAPKPAATSHQRPRLDGRVGGRACTSGGIHLERVPEVVLVESIDERQQEMLKLHQPNTTLVGDAEQVALERRQPPGQLLAVLEE